MEAILGILLKIFGEAWRKFCQLLPSPIELSCQQGVSSSQQLKVLFALRNRSTEPIRDYAITIHLPASVTCHLMNRNAEELRKDLTLSYIGPMIWDEARRPKVSGGFLHHVEMIRAKPSDHPLLPAGPAIPVAELDFSLGSDPKTTLSELSKYPIKVEYWGGRGTKHEAIMFLHDKGGQLQYIEARRQLSPGPADRHQ